MDDGDSKEEPDFIETHCYWTDCDREFGNQDDLVKVSCMNARRLGKGKFHECRTTWQR
jgi:hypothetical protein